MARLRTAVLISGRGSNLQALIDAAAHPGWNAEIVVVVSDRADAYGLLRAERAGISTRVIKRGDFRDRAAFDEALHGVLVEAGAEFICLAGFMRVLGPAFVARWRDRVINIHPSLLPAFKGLNAHEQVLEAGARITGCTVHFVRPAVDSGPIIVQAAVPVHPDDTPEGLEARVLEAEHHCYPLALGLIAEGRVRVEGEVVRIEGAPAPENVLINPAPRSPDSPS